MLLLMGVPGTPPVSRARRWSWACWGVSVLPGAGRDGDARGGAQSPAHKEVELPVVSSKRDTHSHAPAPPRRPPPAAPRDPFHHLCPALSRFIRPPPPRRPTRPWIPSRPGPRRWRVAVPMGEESFLVTSVAPRWAMGGDGGLQDAQQRPSRGLAHLTVLS